MAKKSLKSLKHQVDGRVEGQRITSLDQVFGFSLAKYKTQNENEYETSLAEMNLADLQRECVRVGLLPKDDRVVMKDRLLKEFRRNIAAVLGAKDAKPIVLKVSKEAMAIVAGSANRPT